jgi:DNA-binding beta-propeller fold protein YncE
LRDKAFLAVAVLVLLSGCGNALPVEPVDVPSSFQDEWSDNAADGLVGEDQNMPSEIRDCKVGPCGNDLDKIDDADEVSVLLDGFSADSPSEERSDSGQACDPETAPCPCIGPDDCLEGSWCDATVCRPWVCIPDSKFCHDSTLALCLMEGSGIKVIEDCDDGDPCTLGDGCEAGRCLPRTSMACDDNNPCTIDSCMPATGECEFLPADGTACNDNNPCTIKDHCDAGKCVSGGDASCSDSNPCTDDHCNLLLGCVHVPVAGSCLPADDPCLASGECFEGTCIGLPIDCSDGDICTQDTCLDGSCVNDPVPACACETFLDCDDGNSCTLDTCAAGHCSHSTANQPGCCGQDIECNDGDNCTINRCHEARCVQAPAPNPICCTPQPFQTGFDDGSSVPFELDAPGKDGIGWHVIPAQAAVGNALVFGNTLGTTYDNGERASGSATSPPVTLPAGVRLTLEFRTWQDVEMAPGQDQFFVEVIEQQDLASVAWTRPANFPMRSWQNVTLDLSAMTGKTIRLRFRFDTLDGIANDGQGVVVDDVSITSPCQPSSCNRSSDCTSLGWHAECLQGSCSYLSVLSVQSTPGATGSGISLKGPSDVAVAPDGSRIFVSDRDAHRVLILTDGAAKDAGSFGGQGTAPGLFQFPRGLAADTDHVYVADSLNHRIQTFSPAGVFLWTVGSKGEGPGSFNDPKGLGLSADGDVLWVADTGNHRVQGISPFGTVQVVIGSYGRLDGQFRSPSCAVALPDGGVLVCDTQNGRLQAFSKTGVHLATIVPDDGIALAQPYGAAVMGGDRFFVSDTYNHRLVVMDLTGRVDDRYGAYGSGPAEFAYPLGMEFDTRGRLLVVDSVNLRLVVLGRGPVP